MAVRLPVVMIQASAGSAAAQQLSEAVVGEVIGLPGIDMMLVGPLRQLDHESTDRLTLSSLGGDAAVLDWQAPEQIVQELSQIGFEGARAPHPHDSEPPPTERNRRRIYAFDLRQFASARQVAKALIALNESRKVRTFSLGGPGSAGMPTSAGMPGAAAATPATSRSTTAASRAETGGPLTAASPDRVAPVPRRTPPNSAAESDSSADPLDLDHLLDQLDEMDP